MIERLVYIKECVQSKVWVKENEREHCVYKVLQRDNVSVIDLIGFI